MGCVIVTYNSEHTITRCISSLRAAGISEIVVVDNNSPDTIRSTLERMPVTLIQNVQNKGFATAANQGAREIQASYLLFLNPDAYFTDLHALSLATGYLDNHPSVAVVGLALRDSEGMLEANSFGSSVTLRSLFWRKLRPTHTPRHPLEAGWVSGGSMLVRKEAFWEVGGFDEKFFMYWEDVDLCHRLRKAGYRIVLLPSVRATHIRGASSPSRTQKTAFYDESADRYFRKHYPTYIWYSQRILRRIYRFFSPRVR